MNTFGYSKSDDNELLDLKEVTIQGTKSDIEKVIKFLRHCADNIDSEDWEHEHLSDFCEQIGMTPDIVVVKSQ